MNKQLKPLHDRVIVKREEAEKISEVIVTLASSSERPIRGTVIAVGPKCETVQRGDTVVFGKYSGNDIKHEGQEYLAIKEEDIFAVIG